MRAQGLFAFGAATTAVVLAAGFTVWALLFPAYSSGETILAVNPEWTVRLAVALPLLITGTAWMLLHHACRDDARWARSVAKGIGWVLVAFSVVTGFSIGLLVAPLALLLAAAAALTPVRVA